MFKINMLLLYVFFYYFLIAPTHFLTAFYINIYLLNEVIKHSSRTDNYGQHLTSAYYDGFD